MNVHITLVVKLTMNDLLKFLNIYRNPLRNCVDVIQLYNLKVFLKLYVEPQALDVLDVYN